MRSLTIEEKEYIDFLKEQVEYSKEELLEVEDYIPSSNEQGFEGWLYIYHQIVDEICRMEEKIQMIEGE